MKERDLSLDIIRIIACVMVVIMHSPMPSSRANGLFLSSLSYFTAPCIGLFFMVSGALLLPPPQKRQEHCITAGSFLRKRLNKVLFPTVVWSFLYILHNYLNGSMEWHDIMKSVISLPFSAQGNGVLWFMYTLLGLYLLTPILHGWIKYTSHKEICFYLMLWCVTLLYPILKNLLVVNETNTGVLYYFSGYVGYFVFGYWLQNYGDRIDNKLVIAMMVVSIVCPVIVKLTHWQVDFYEVFWYLSVFVAMQCLFWWKMTKAFVTKFSFGIRTRNILAILSNLSFGVYLSHIFIMRCVLWNIELIKNIPSQMIQTVVVAILTLLIAFGLSYVISMTVMGNVIVGYFNKK